MKCTYCDGQGWTSEHDPEDTRREHYEDGDCRSCPVQVQCEKCQATGLALLEEKI